MQTQPLLPRKIAPVLVLILLTAVGLIWGHRLLTDSQQPFLDSFLNALPTDEALVRWLTVG